jgi:hypothetical protein
MCVRDEEGFGGTVARGQDISVTSGRRRWAKLGWLSLKSAGGFLAWVHPVLPGFHAFAVGRRAHGVALEQAG